MLASPSPALSLPTRGHHDPTAPTLYRGPPAPQSLPPDHRDLCLPPQGDRPLLPPQPRATQRRTGPPLPSLPVAPEKSLLGLVQPGRQRLTLLFSGHLSDARYGPPYALR